MKQFAELAIYTHHKHMLSADIRFWLANNQGGHSYHIFDVISVMYLTYNVTDDVRMAIATAGRLLWRFNICVGSLAVFDWM